MLRKSFKFKKCLSSFLYRKSSVFFSQANDESKTGSSNEAQNKKSIYDVNVAQDYVKENIRYFTKPPVNHKEI